MTIKKPHLALKKKALAAVKNLELDISKLTKADVHALPMPLKIRNVLADMVGTDSTIEKIEDEIANIEITESTYSEVDEKVEATHYDPVTEIKEKVTNDYNEPVVEDETFDVPVVDEDVVEVTLYSEAELAEIAATTPKRSKSVPAIMKHVASKVEDKEAVDADLLSKVAKAEAAKRKAD